METFGNEMTLDRYDRWRKGSSVVDPRLTPIGFQQSYRENLYIYIYISKYIWRRVNGACFSVYVERSGFSAPFVVFQKPSSSAIGVYTRWLV